MLDPRCALLIKFVEAAPERGGGWGELWQNGSESRPEKIRLYSPGDPEVLYNLGIAYFHQYEWKAYKRAVACLKDATDIARLISGSFHPSASNCYRDQFWLR